MTTLDTAEAASDQAPGQPLLPPALRIALLQIALLAVLLAAWELAIRFGWIAVYLYGRPSGIFAKAATLLMSGELLRDSALTAWEAIAGFMLGTLLGSATGLLLWLFPTSAAVLRPYLIALNGLPKIALAPLIIVWFGIGISSKIAIAAIITFIVAVITAQQGAHHDKPGFEGESEFVGRRSLVIPAGVQIGSKA